MFRKVQKERDALEARLADMTAEADSWRANARDSGEEARKYKARLAEAVAALHGIAHADTEASALRLRFMAADALIAHNTASSAEPREDAAHG